MPQIRCSTCFPQRYVFAVMGFYLTFVAYMMRISLDITISHMVNATSNGTALNNFDPNSCPHLIANFSQQNYDPFANVTPGTLDWDEDTQAYTTGAFATSYIMTQFIGGMLGDKGAGKNALLACLTALSLCTVLAPFAAKLIGSVGLYVLRFISGLSSGPIIPALTSMMSKWVPKDERAFIGSIIFPGAIIGHAVGTSLGQAFVKTAGWEVVFYVFGAFGLLFSVMWYFLVYSNPNEHPSITKGERKYLNENVTALIRTNNYELDPLPWNGFLRSGALWGAVIGYIGREWSFSTFTSQVPQYMRSVLGLDIGLYPVLSCMPYVSMWIAALLFGFTCDALIKKDWLSIRNARRWFTTFATTWSIISIIVVMYSGCSPTVVTVFMFLGMIATGAHYSGCLINTLDFSPNYAGTMVAVTDSVPHFSTMLLPSLNALIIPEVLLYQWRISFWIIITILIICIPIYFYFCQGEQAWWDDVRKNGYPDEWKHGLFACTGYINENGESTFPPNKRPQLEEIEMLSS